MSFAENFKAARKAAGLSQQQVADELGLDRTSIAKYENGVSFPNMRNMPKICELLHVSMDEIMK